MLSMASQDMTFMRYRGSYADPHSTIAIRDIPTHLKHVIRLCRFYYSQDALLGAITDKMAEYPITQILVRSASRDELTPDARDKWQNLNNVVLNLRQVLIEINVDEYVSGNSFIYIYYPFVRYCICQNCRKRTVIGNLKKVRAAGVDGKTETNEDFTFTVQSTCPHCKRDAKFDVQDRKSEARSGMRLVRLNPLSMELEYSPASGHRYWYWDPPKRIRDGFQNGDRTIIDYCEMKTLAAAHRGLKIKIDRDRLWVAQAPGQPGLWEGWGIPPIFRVLEDVYYYKILRRANEALAQEHIVPLRIISPAGTGDVSPQRTMHLQDWRNRMRDELYNWKRDPNYLMLSPIPLNVEQVGGQARVMMVAAEMEAAARVIAAGIGCPIEMIWGGLNWSGASVSLRVLENHFINTRENSERFLHFLAPKIAAYFRLPRATLKLAEFKMADDVQQQATAVNLMMQGFLSRESVLGEMDYDPTEEFENMEKEHARLNSITMKDNVAASHMNVIIQTLEAKAQVLMQYELQVLQQEIQAQSERERLQLLRNHVAKLHEAGYTSPIEFEQSAMLLGRMDPMLAGMILTEWQATMPNTVLLLQEKMRLNQVQTANAATAMQTAQSSSPAPGAAGGVEGGTPMGAQGPYSEGGEGSGGAEAAGSAQDSLGGATSALPPVGGDQQQQPEARPPRRQGS